MEKELDPDVIKTTQTLLGKYVKRPPLSEKLLKKPPFRFLHDIVTTVLRTTGFFEGLFEEDELISDNVKDRDSKILFLNKVISVIGLTTGKTLTVKPSKIVAGQEPDKTNELLQSLALALDSKLSSREAVGKYNENSKTSHNANAKSKETNKTAKKSNETKTLTSKSKERLSNNPHKRDTKERSTTRKEKTNDKNKDNSSVKNSSQNSIRQHTNALVKNQNKQSQNEPLQNIATNNTSDVKLDTLQIAEIGDDKLKTDNHEDKEDILKEHKNLISTMEQNIPDKLHNSHGELNTSYTIIENDLNSSFSSQELIETDKPKTTSISEPGDARDMKNFDEQGTTENRSNDDYTKENHQNLILNPRLETPTENEDTKQQNLKEVSKNNVIERQDSEITVGNRTNIVRPLSVRPSSSRPGAPRPREKLHNLISETDNFVLGKVNIIAEQEHNEEEEDTSIIIVEQNEDITSIPDDQHEKLQLSSNVHGHLVQQILDSQKEFSHISGKTEIEWQLGAQKAKEAQYQEIEQLRFNIQALSRVANPLGKLLDHIQEDVEVMRQELQQWTNIYDEVSKEMHKQKISNEDSLLPLHSKLNQLEGEIEEKHDKINDLKILIYKNTSRIERLLYSGGNVQ